MYWLLFGIFATNSQGLRIRHETRTVSQALMGMGSGDSPACEFLLCSTLRLEHWVRRLATRSLPLIPGVFGSGKSCACVKIFSKRSIYWPPRISSTSPLGIPRLSFDFQMWFYELAARITLWIRSQYPSLGLLGQLPTLLPSPAKAVPSFRVY